MNLANKVLVLPNICGIEIDLSSILKPTIQPSLQPFFNTYIQNSQPIPVYTTPSKISFEETAEDTRAGMLYKQKLSLRFPSNDPLRALRISQYLKAKYLYIKLNNNMVFFMGRNDFFQNTPIKSSMQSNEKTTSITYTNESMFPTGFTNGSFDFSLPEDFPINFYNL